MKTTTTTGAPKWFASVYYLNDTDLGSGKKKEKSRPFPKLLNKTRDCLALLELSRLLAKEGYQYGGPMQQIPYDVWANGRRCPNVQDAKIQSGARDLLVQATRPPVIEDGTRPSVDDSGVKRSLALAGTDSEKYICEALGRFVATCDRSQMILQRNVLLPSGCDKYRAVSFKQSGGGLAKELATAAGRKGEEAPANLAIGYLLSVPHLYRGGPRLLLSFSMGGAESLWFCHVLVEKLNKLYLKALKCRKPRFWLVPFECPDYTPFPALACSSHCVDAKDVIEAKLKTS